MLALGVTGAYLGYRKQEFQNGTMGLFTCYLMATGWLAGRRREKSTGWVDWMAPVLGGAVAAALIWLGWHELLYPGRFRDGRAEAGFVFGSVALLAAAGDVSLLVRGGTTGARRVARHLWRLGFGFFIATVSFFLGQQQVLPEAVRGSWILVVLALLPLPLMLYWLARVRGVFGQRAGASAAADGWERAAG
jgi:hypothetical protein